MKGSGSGSALEAERFANDCSFLTRPSPTVFSRAHRLLMNT